MLSLGMGSLAHTRTCHRVLIGWKDVLMPNGARILLMDSEVFFTYRAFGGVVSWLGGELWCVCCSITFQG